MQIYVLCLENDTFATLQVLADGIPEEYIPIFITPQKAFAFGAIMGGNFGKGQNLKIANFDIPNKNEFRKKLQSLERARFIFEDEPGFLALIESVINSK
jgi:hypothetical protein